MHFSTASGSAGDSGFLESRFLYPKPGVQCLQFFLYSSGGANDSLKMWVREYDELYPQGRMTLFETITGVFKSTLSSLLKSTLRWASFRWDVKPRSWLPVAHWCPGPISNLGSCVIMAICVLFVNRTKKPLWLLRMLTMSVYLSNTPKVQADHGSCITWL